jgi:hypothetical protein
VDILRKRASHPYIGAETVSSPAQSKEGITEPAKLREYTASRGPARHELLRALAPTFKEDG